MAASTWSACPSIGTRTASTSTPVILMALPPLRDWRAAARRPGPDDSGAGRRAQPRRSPGAPQRRIGPSLLSTEPFGALGPVGDTGPVCIVGPVGLVVSYRPAGRGRRGG